MAAGVVNVLVAEPCVGGSSSSSCCEIWCSIRCSAGRDGIIIISSSSSSSSSMIISRRCGSGSQFAVQIPE